MIFLVISILVVQIRKSTLRIGHNKRQIYKYYNSTIFWIPTNGPNAALQCFPSSLPPPPWLFCFLHFKRLPSYCPPKAHVQTTSVPQQSIQRIFHIPRTFFLSLAIDYCTLVRVIQVNKVFISLLAMGAQGLPTPPVHVSKITRYKIFNWTWVMTYLIWYSTTITS